MKHTLRWDTEFDDYDNTVWEAVGGSTDGQSGDLHYRIEQELRDDMHVFVEASDAELLMEPGGEPKRFASMSAAMRAMNIAYNSALESSCLG